VFAVRHADSHKLDELDYALKVIDMKDLREARGMADNSKMLAEVVTLAKLQHGHHIARYFHAQEFPRASADEPNIADFLVIRLELCKGGTIRQLLDDCRRRDGNGIPIELVRRYLAQLAEAFSFMEDRNIVHRDFKLDNVCLSEIGGDCRLVDLGFAWEYGGNNPSRALQAGHNSTLREGRGHMNYRSPENNGETKVDHKDDM
jgi:serine/threonine protein kinase